MRVVIKPAGLLILIVIIATLSSVAFFGMPRPRAAAVAKTADKSDSAKSPTGLNFYGDRAWGLAAITPEAAELQVSTGAVPGVGEPVKIYKVLVKKATENPWDVSLFLPTPATLAKNEKLRLTFRARSDDAVPCIANFEQNSAPYPKSGELKVATTRDWNQYTLEFASRDNYAPDKSHTTFHLGTKKGMIEIADMRLERIAK
ncbi:MAG: hypothetical protein H8F28_27035 [Fibrella sp.]|nr:hypothetical protein [Armatimonadota bacterium]